MLRVFPALFDWLLSLPGRFQEGQKKAGTPGEGMPKDHSTPDRMRNDIFSAGSIPGDDSSIDGRQTGYLQEDSRQAGYLQEGDCQTDTRKTGIPQEGNINAAGSSGADVFASGKGHTMSSGNLAGIGWRHPWIWLLLILPAVPAGYACYRRKKRSGHG